jgi:serine/threonine-protein kinase
VSSDPDIGDPRLGRQVGDRYRLLERLAVGGMGVVYRGDAVADGRPVAVKFLHESFVAAPDIVQRFQREVAAMQRLSHPNLIEVLDTGASGGVPYLVMPFESGASLGDALVSGPIPPPRAVGIALEILSGVAHAHQHGVLHRDLKPDNVLLVDDRGERRVKIVDFGLAKLVDDLDGPRLTQTGMAFGTPAYMAPEQAQGAATDARTDLYAVGIILYEMLVGRPPFDADSPMAIVKMQIEAAYAALRDAAPKAAISAELEGVVDRALVKRPQRRWQDAAEFARALASTPEGRASMAARAHRPRARRLRRAAVMLVALLAICAVGGTIAWRVDRADSPPPVRWIARMARATTVAVRRLAAWVGGALVREESAETPGARLEAKARRDSASEIEQTPRRTIDEAERLLARGQANDAMQVLYRVRLQAPESPAVALLLGHAYFDKAWRADALREYDTALQLRPSLRSDQRIIHNVVEALAGPTFAQARDLIVDRLGDSALGELRRAGHSAASQTVRARADMVVRDLQAGSH